MWVILVVILPLFWNGITCQVPGYSIRVTSGVGVQEGLCVTIPCNFTADSRNTFINSSGYWILKQEPNTPLYIVATNNKSREVKKSNFRLTGNPDTGDCTLSITDARKEDEGEYHFRFEDGKDKRLRYNYNKDATTLITVTDLTEEPVISDIGTVIAGVSKTLTCSPPRNCSETQLTLQWRKSNVAGVWKENTSTITFIPSMNDDQENITCEMTNIRGKTTRKSILLDVHCNKRPSSDSSGPGGSPGCPQPVLPLYTTIFIGMVIGNIAALILIFVGTYFFLKRKMESRQLAKASPDPATQGTEPTYQDLKGQNNDVYHNFKMQ